MRNWVQGDVGRKLAFVERFAHWRGKPGVTSTSASAAKTLARVPPTGPEEEIGSIGTGTTVLALSETLTPMSQSLAEADPPDAHVDVRSNIGSVMEMQEVLCRVGTREVVGSPAAEWKSCSLSLTPEALELVTLAGYGPPEVTTPSGAFAVCPIGFKPDASGGGQHVLSIPLLHVVDVSAAASCGGSSSSAQRPAVDAQPEEADVHGQSGKPNLSERSTFEGSSSAFEGGSGCTNEGPSPPLTPAEEWLVNGVDVGSFDLPPIPLARLPETRQGLPASKPVALKENSCSVPVGEFDGSNCRFQAFTGSIPPLPAAVCRLPSRDHRELRPERADDLKVLSRSSAELPVGGAPSGTHVLVVWTGTSESLARSSGQTRRLQQGTPVFVAFKAQEEAEDFLKVILRLRGARLAGSSIAGVGVAGDSIKGPSPRFGSSP